MGEGPERSKMRECPRACNAKWYETESYEYYDKRYKMIHRGNHIIGVHYCTLDHGHEGLVEVEIEDSKEIRYMVRIHKCRCGSLHAAKKRFKTLKPWERGEGC